MELLGQVMCWVFLMCSVVMGVVSLTAFLSFEYDYQDPGLFFGGWCLGVLGMIALWMLGGL